MSPAKHLAASAAFGAGIYLLTRDGGHAAAAGAGGVLIDLDHIWDFSREWGVRDGLRRLMENLLHGGRHRVTRLYLLLHNWDVLFALALLAVFGLGNFFSCPPCWAARCIFFSISSRTRRGPFRIFSPTGYRRDSGGSCSSILPGISAPRKIAPPPKGA